MERGGWLWHGEWRSKYDAIDQVQFFVNQLRFTLNSRTFCSCTARETLWCQFHVSSKNGGCGQPSIEQAKEVCLSWP